MAKARIHGYCDRISVKAGDTVRFMVSAQGADQVEARLVRWKVVKRRFWIC